MANLVPLKVPFFDDNANFLVSGKLYTYQAGTTTPLATYTDYTGNTANANPIILNGRGECNLWATAGSAYKFVLKTSADVTIWTMDNVTTGDADDMVFLQAGTGAVSRSAQDKMREIVSVKDFGAVGDGVTDDTAAIRTAAQAAAGKSLYWPAGTYLVTFTPGQRIIPASSNTEYFGDGPASVIKIKNGSAVGVLTLDFISMFFLDNVDNVSIHDLTLDGNRSNITHPSETPPLIYVINGSSNIHVFNNTLLNPGGDGVIVGAAGGGTLGGEKVIITNNVVVNPGRSCFVCTSARDVVISNNLGYDAFNSYIDIETDLLAEFVVNVTVTGNVFRSTSGLTATGFACAGPGTHANIVVNGNVFSSVLQGASLGSALNNGIVFTNNIISGAYSTGTKYMIEVIGGMKAGVISNNLISITAPTTSGGIWVRGPYGVAIENNTIEYVGYSSAINVDDPYGLAPATVKVCNNTIRYGDAGAGITVTGEINSLVSGNYLDMSAAGTTGIAVGGATTLNTTISSNTVKTSALTGNGIYAFDMPRAIISNNHVTGFDLGIYVINQANQRVLGNHVEASNTGIYFTNADYTTCSDNFVTLCELNGVQFDNGEYAIIKGNTVTNNSQSSAGTYYGVVINQSNMIVTDNMITDTQSVKTQGFALRGTGGTDHHWFIGNMLAGNLTGAFSNLPGGANYYPSIAGVFATDMADFNRLT